jgi:GGDEF domain-containing protein
MTPGSPLAPGERLPLPCHQAGLSCPAESRQPRCVLTREHIDEARRRNDSGFLGTVALCQHAGNQAGGKDQKTGLDTLETMLGKAQRRFSHPPRRMDQVLDERSGKFVLTALVAFMDANEFSRLNEVNHDVGDNGLSLLAQLWIDNTRENDLLARWSEKRSDEIVAIMPGMPYVVNDPHQKNANQKGLELQTNFMNGVEVPLPDGGSTLLTAAVGTTYVYGAESIEDIRRGISMADEAVVAWKKDRQGLPEPQYLTLPGYRLPELPTS